MIAPPMTKAIAAPSMPASLSHVLVEVIHPKPIIAPKPMKKISMRPSERLNLSLPCGLVSVWVLTIAPPASSEEVFMAPTGRRGALGHPTKRRSPSKRCRLPSADAATCGKRSASAATIPA